MSNIATSGDRSRPYESGERPMTGTFPQLTPARRALVERLFGEVAR